MSERAVTLPEIDRPVAELAVPESGSPEAAGAE
jgi:hypothetical protein